jgi:hypothetical protein
MSMHEQTPPADTDALEQRLRRHLTATYGPPPAPDDVWQRIAGRLADSPPDGRASAPSDSSPRVLDTNADLTHRHLRPARPLAFSTPAALPALAAVLLLAVLAAVILGPLRPRGGAAPVPTSTAGPHTEIPLPTSAPGQYQVHILQPDEVVPGVSFLGMRVFASGEGWAVGQKRTGPASYESAIYHLKDGRWLPADDVFPNVSLSALAMVSPSEGWAAGFHGVIAHYQDGRWTRWPTSTPGDFPGIMMVSPTDGWMSGTTPSPDVPTTPDRTFTLHYDGRDWRPFTMPALPPLPPGLPNVLAGGSSLDSAVTSFAMLSASEGWAAGDNHGAASAIYHYTGGVWHLENIAVNQSLQAIAMVSPDEGWALGAERIIAVGDEAAVILHYAHGVWTIYKP